MYLQEEKRNTNQLKSFSFCRSFLDVKYIATGAKQGNGTYAGLKNCSNTTYIPRNISDIKKYFVALSTDVSDP